ncbi:MAG: hypothetical protein ACRCZA_08415 [Shewanella sp.]|uniref:hypothetical protein n=1 Tax=Shewanella sp. TaxID=50422 RepID=UPI003F31C722
MIGLYNELLQRNEHIEMGNPERWFVAYEATDKRGGLLLNRLPECAIIEFAALEQRGSGQIRRLLAACNRYFNDDVKGVCLDIDSPDVWRHLGFTHSALIDFTPHQFTEPTESIFVNTKHTDGVDIGELFKIMEQRQALKDTRIVLKGLV